MISERHKKLGENRSTIRELFEYGKILKAEYGAENVYDFSIGNPSIPCPPAVTETLTDLLTNEDAVALHSYTSSAGDPGTRAAIAEYLNKRYGIGAEAGVIYMTCGAAASLTITLNAVAHEGEEVIIFTPYFPEYKVFAEQTGATCVFVPLKAPEFQPDFEALKAALTEKTAALIINSPHNPTGSILTEESLKKLGEILREKEEEVGHAIYLISDEPYRELNYTDTPTPFVIPYYTDTIVCYSYSKSLSLPGERIGYILVSPASKDRQALFAAVQGAGRSLGFVCAPSLLQKAIQKLQGALSDISIYDTNRQLLYNGLKEIGYEAVRPDGAFYLFLKVPGGDAVAFSEKAKKHRLLVVPSDDFGAPGYVRISYCVETDMIRRSLPAFEELFKEITEE